MKFFNDFKRTRKGYLAGYSPLTIVREVEDASTFETPELYTRYCYELNIRYNYVITQEVVDNTTYNIAEHVEQTFKNNLKHYLYSEIKDGLYEVHLHLANHNIEEATETLGNIINMINEQ